MGSEFVGFMIIRGPAIPARTWPSPPISLGSHSPMAGETEGKLDDPMVLDQGSGSDPSIAELCLTLKTKLAESLDSSRCAGSQTCFPPSDAVPFAPDICHHFRWSVSYGAAGRVSHHYP